MSFIEIILVSLGLAMDAFGVSIGKGLSMPAGTNGKKLILAALFGVFQFAMPLIGWMIGRQFISVIAEFDHWVIFVMLGYIGIAMIREGLSDDVEDETDKPILGIWEMIMLAVATSLDAMAVGLTFAFMNINVWHVSALIGIITLGVSLVGLYLGKWMGRFIGKYADILGGTVLIIIGIKILLEHLGYIR